MVVEEVLSLVTTRVDDVLKKLDVIKIRNDKQKKPFTAL